MAALTRLDEWPRHQVARTFDSVQSDSAHWSDGYYFTLSDPEGELSLYTAIRLYPNNDVLDGYACVGVDGQQHNLRCSRRLRPAIDELSVGPLAVEVLEPLVSLRTTCAPNEHGISYDLTWTGLHAPHLEDFVERQSAGRLTAQRCNYGQCCSVSGWVEVHGTRRVVDDRWVGVRDHSWGLGRTGGPQGPNAAPTAAAPGFAVRQWAMVRFPSRVVFWQLHQDADGSFPMLETRVLTDYPWSWTGVEALDLELVPGHRRLRSATLALRRPDGELDRFRITPIGTPVYLQGGGYWQGFDDGLGRGVYRGDLHCEGETWDVSDPSRIVDPRGLVRPRPDAWAESFALVHDLSHPDEIGLGHVECVIAGPHPDLATDLATDLEST